MYSEQYGHVSGSSGLQFSLDTLTPETFLTPETIVVPSTSLQRPPPLFHPDYHLSMFSPNASSAMIPEIVRPITMTREDLEHGKYAANGQLLVYPCNWDHGSSPCGVCIEGDKQRIGKHLHAWHHVTGDHRQDITCQWEGCNRRMKKGSLARHIVSRHLSKKFLCSNCGTELAREDAWQRHCIQATNCRFYGTTAVHGPNVRVVDTRALFGTARMVYDA